MKKSTYIFKEMCKKISKNYFVGSKTTSDYLKYVLGNTFDLIQVDKCKNYNKECFYIYDDVTSSYEEHDHENEIMLSDFLNVLNTCKVCSDKPIALWGAGEELNSKFDIICKYLEPSLIIDKNRKEDYRGIKCVTPDEINLGDYYIIITTTKYASEIQEYLNYKGYKEGTDYILGFDPSFVNDNAEMFIKTITDHPLEKVNCRRPFEYLNVGPDGILTHCCYQWLPKYIGNVLYDNIGFDSITSRIIRVSFMNCTYSFCNSVCCPIMSKEREKLYSNNNAVIDNDVYLQHQNIKQVDVAFDYTCNLFCESCRNDYVIDKTKEPLLIAEKVKSKLMTSASIMTVAGNGEAFLSKAYQSLLVERFPNMRMIILSNGNLFTEDKWKLIEGNFGIINLVFSIDASCKETYEKIRRGGKWDNLIRGLELASKLRKERKIDLFVLRFVVSKKNYKEMPDFVELGLRMGCDYVDFSRIENWGTFTKDEFSEISMFDGDKPKPELEDILQKEIMKNPIVKYTNIVMN